MAVYPRQKISSVEKNKKDAVTGKTPMEATIDYFIDETIQSNNREEILSFYRLTEDVLDTKDYDYVLNPFNTTVDRYKRFGATLRNFNILTPVLNLYAGEYSQRFKNIQVIDTDSFEDNEYKDGLNKVVEAFYNQQMINNLNSLGLETGKQSQEQDSIQEHVDKYNRSFDDNKVITGQEILDYIVFDQDLDDKYQDAYMDWLKAGTVVSYKGVSNDDIDFEIVPPWEVSFPDNFKTNFIEDRDWITRRQVLTANQILDRWHDKLTDKDVTWLEQEAMNGSLGVANGYVRLSTEWINSKQDYEKYSILSQINGIEVYHVQHRSFKKIGIVLFLNKLHQIKEKEVDDTYKLDKVNGDISVKWEWISEVREGWRIGEEGRGLYLDVRSLPYNRMALNNSSEQKLSYNGRVNRSLTGKPLSIVSAGRSYQIIYNVLHYQFEKTINKNKDKVVVIPQGLIPKGKHGWDEEKFMYYAHANSFMVVDETAPTAALSLSGIKILDMGLASYAKDTITLMEAVKSEWWDAIGMNRQRYGDSKASDGKAVTEQAIYRSAVISEELNRKFEKFQEKDYEGLLDISKIAYIKGKKAKYINSDEREAYLKLNPDDAIRHLGRDMNVFVKNSKRENEKLNLAKQYGFNLGQNGETIQMLELIDASNFAKTKEVINKMDAAKNEREAAAQKATLDSNQNIADTKAKSEQEDRDVKKYIADKQYDTAIDVKELEMGNSINNEDRDRDRNGDTKEQNDRMNTHKIETDRAKQATKDKEVAIKNKEANAKIKNLQLNKANN